MVDTPLGQRIGQAAGAYRREFIFVCTEPAAMFDPTLASCCEDTVLVRGIVDGVLPTDDGLEIIDFKTDSVKADAVETRTVDYKLQMQLYGRALARIWRRPVVRSWLVFLAPRRVIEVVRE